MAGADATTRTWCDALLRDDHDIAALVVVDGVVVQANRAGRELFAGVRAGVPVAALFDAPCRGKLAAALSGGAAAGATELQALRGHDPPVPVRALVLAGLAGERLLLAGGGGLGYGEAIAAKLLAANDSLVTLARQLSRDVRDAEDGRASLVRIDNLRELFITAMAHDLKSPLNAILLGEEALRDRDAPPEMAEIQRHTDRVVRSVRHMAELIDGLLVSARLEAADPGLPRDDVRVDEIARQAAEAMSPLADQAGVELQVQAEGVALVQGSAVWLREVFVNLLTNAIRHAPAGSPVEVRVLPSAAMVRCEVLDRGPGIPPAERQGLFERYVERGQRRGTSGLGLYISRKVLDHHQGRIWIEDSPGGGARVVFEIPTAR